MSVCGSRGRHRTLRATLSSSPAAVSVTNSELPPAEKNGSVRPVTGISAGDAADVDDGLHHEPGDDAAGEQAWKRSCAASATCTPQYVSTRNDPSTATTPIMPSSSAMTAKMKSLCASGRKSPNLFSPRPTPGAADAALRHGDHRLPRLVAEVVLVGRDVQECRETA